MRWLIQRIREQARSHFFDLCSVQNFT